MRNIYTEQNRSICTSMKTNQTQFMKLCLADSLIKLMTTQQFDSINIHDICKLAHIGRTTFYRHFQNKNNKEELIIFKIMYEWEQYSVLHDNDIKEDKGFALLNFIYDHRHLFRLLYNQKLITTIMHVFEQIIQDEGQCDKNLSYLMSYFTYGYFGIIYQWLKYDFDETPKQIQKHITDAFLSATQRED